MFIHLGGNVVIPTREVVAIIDLEMAHAKSTDEFLSSLRDRGDVIDVSEGKAKSFVITTHQVYLSQISATTLMKRAEGLIDYLESL